MKTIFFLTLCLFSTLAGSASFSYSDPNCKAFNMVNGIISCQGASAPPAPPVYVPPAAEAGSVIDPGCPSGYTYTVVPITWEQQISIKGPLHTMNHCEVKAFQFTMPSRPDPVQSQTVYAITQKYLSLSQTAFDFGPELEASGCAGGGYNNPIIWNSTLSSAGVCTTVAGATYYLSVRNSSSRAGADNCLAGKNCTFYMAW